MRGAGHDQRVLMINKTDDELFGAEGTRDVFHALATPRKRLTFWPGNHDDWPPDAITESIVFINTA